jgi:beta-lactamase superfamily II metal-dependent hydrolase
LEGLAFVLDQALNNTSVVVLVSYLGRNLLFPGDAQFGAWKHWMQQPDGEEILASLDFYKVSHHGSENATPKSALERMATARVAAMVSTQQTPWPSIPDRKLMDAIEARTGNPVVRSDSLPVGDAPVVPGFATLPDGIVSGDLWYDLTIPV